MNKIQKLLFAAAALVAFSSCSSDEDIIPAGTPEGDIVVRVTTQDAEAGSRTGVEAIPGYHLNA